VLEIGPFSDCFYHSGSKKTRNCPDQFGFLPNCSLNQVREYWSPKLVCGMPNMPFHTAHHLGVSDFAYHTNSASSCEKCAMLGPETRFLPNHLLNFNEIENRRTPKDAPCHAAYWIYEKLKLSDQYSWTWLDSSLKRSSIFDGERPLPCRPIKPARSKTGTVTNTTHRWCMVHHLSVDHAVVDLLKSIRKPVKQ